MKVLVIMTALEVGEAEIYVLRLAKILSNRVELTVALPDHAGIDLFAKETEQWTPLPDRSRTRHTC